METIATFLLKQVIRLFDADDSVKAEVFRAIAKRSLTELAKLAQSTAAIDKIQADLDKAVPPK